MGISSKAYSFELQLNQLVKPIPTLNTFFVVALSPQFLRATGLSNMFSILLLLRIRLGPYMDIYLACS